ncbi:hypothetical protein KXD40_003207 [Peronospora effusa]|nr:hypothetical protein KXD40_003207 [Peronospora effusa]
MYSSCWLDFLLHCGRAQGVSVFALVQGALATKPEVAVRLAGIIDNDLCPRGNIGLRHQRHDHSSPPPHLMEVGVRGTRMLYEPRHRAALFRADVHAACFRVPLAQFYRIRRLTWGVQYVLALILADHTSCWYGPRRHHADSRACHLQLQESLSELVVARFRNLRARNRLTYLLLRRVRTRRDLASSFTSHFSSRAPGMLKEIL